jgi:gliding motility-associated-like protein
MKSKNNYINLPNKIVSLLGLLFCLSLSINQNLCAQASFTAQDTICIYDSVVIQNLSRDASSYYWNFCSGNLAYNPEGENLPNTEKLDGPAFIDFAEDNDLYYAFITNHNNGTLTRNFYGNSFLTDPVSENMGNFGVIPAHAQGVQVIQDNGNWFVFVVGGQREESCLIRLDFGTSLSNNNPTVTDLGNIGELDYPVDLYITSDQGNWIGFTVNKNTNTVSRFNFDSGIENAPTGDNLGNPANLYSPCGILPIKDNGNWYIFISNYDGHEITRLDFGASLSATPSGTSIGNSTALHYPFDLTIIRDCERTYGFVLNRFNDIVRLEFNNGLDNEPEFIPLGDIGNLYNPQGISDIFRVGDELYAFVANIDNSSITRLNFPGCTNATPPSSTERNPPTVKYNEPGLYNMNLVLDEGLPEQENYCLNVVVLESPDLNLGNDTVIAAGTTLELSADTLYSAYDWSTGSKAETIEVGESGVYALEITNQYGCKATDEIEVIIDIGIPNFFTPNGDGHNDTWSIPFLTTEPETEIWIYDRFGNAITYYKSGTGEWDGTSNGKPLPQASYWYVIKMPGVKKAYKGSVTIKR